MKFVQRARPGVLPAIALSALALTGCAAMKEWMPTIPAPSISWLYDAKKPDPP